MINTLRFEKVTPLNIKKHRCLYLNSSTNNLHDLYDYNDFLKSNK